MGSQRAETREQQITQKAETWKESQEKVFETWEEKWAKKRGGLREGETKGDRE